MIEQKKVKENKILAKIREIAKVSSPKVIYVAILCTYVHQINTLITLITDGLFCCCCC